MAAPNEVGQIPAGSARTKQRKEKGHTSQDWETIKPDVQRRYIQEDDTLEHTMAEIQKTHSFQACKRSWKFKLNEWGFKKNVKNSHMEFIVYKEAKRKFDGKETEFFHGEAPILAEKIEKFKKRQIGRVEKRARIATPPDISYSTPVYTSDDDDDDGAGTSHRITSNFEEDDKSAFSGCMSEDNHVCKAPSRMLERYLSSKDDPVVFLKHQLGDRDKVLASQRQNLHDISASLVLDDTELDHYSWPSNTAPFTPDGERFWEISFLNDPAAAAKSIALKNSAEDIILSDLCRATAKLAAYQNNYGEFDPRTSKQEYALAKVLEANNSHDEVEYHCRRVLKVDANTYVQCLLGRTLLKVGRAQESAFWLSSALAGFIVQYACCSPGENEEVFRPIADLFSELLCDSEQLNTASLTLCMTNLMTTAGRVFSGDLTEEITRQLFIDGFAFAQECLKIDVIPSDAPEYMFEVLLQHSSNYMNEMVDGNELATARSQYGLLLRRSERWVSSAEQLLMACGSALSAPSQSSRVLRALRGEYEALLPHLPSGAEGKNAIMDKIIKRLNRLDGQLDLEYQTMDIPVGHQASLVDGYLLPSDLPRDPTPEPSAIRYLEQYGVFAKADNPHLGDPDRCSMWSSSGNTSHKFGMTYSSGGLTGVSASVYMVP